MKTTNSMLNINKQYQDCLNVIDTFGYDSAAAREGMPETRAVFGHQYRINLQDGFPLLTLKEMYHPNKTRDSWNDIVHELLWFLKGDTNIRYLLQHKVNIWNGDAYNYYKEACENDNFGQPMILPKADFIEVLKALNAGEETEDSLAEKNIEEPLGYEWGSCGAQYGESWRNYNQEGVDQIQDLIEGLKRNPEGRRHEINNNNPAAKNDVALHWCHVYAQFNCRPLSLSEREIWFTGENHEPRKTSEKILHDILDKEGVPKYYLDVRLNQRSADVILGVPYNIASYALLTHIIAEIVGMIPGDFIHEFGNLHYYNNHSEAVETIKKRDPFKYKLPKLKFSKNFKKAVQFFNGDVKGANNFGLLHRFDGFVDLLNIDDFIIENYESYEKVKAPLSTGS